MSEKREVIREVEQNDDGSIVMSKYVKGEFNTSKEAERALWFKCVDFEFDGTPCTTLKKIGENKYQRMTGEDRAYGHDKHCDIFIHIRKK